mmetsp:Transcript_19418/g.28769  ORF Transcript_19418/g.28769 Transcript_19418/m.28769 type:complete len:260 (-) Transcript_19418:20-799(-)
MKLFDVTGEECCDEFSGYTLVMPVVSTGNVGQLSIDLLLSLGLRNGSVCFKGSMETECLFPICGFEEFSAGRSEMVTSLDVFVLEEKRVLFLQQRSQIFPTFEERFVRGILEWSKDKRIKEILVLSGCEPSATKGKLDRTFLCYKSPDQKRNQIYERILSLGGFPVEINQVLGGGNKFPNGMGISNIFKTLVVREYDLDFVMAILPCCEGDNAPDAAFMAEKVGRCIEMIGEKENIIKWVPPLSWSYLYGSVPEENESM